MSLPFDHTHDLDLQISRWEQLEITLSQELGGGGGGGGVVDMEQKGCELSIHDHVIGFCVTIVGSVVVSDNDGWLQMSVCHQLI